MGSGVRKRAFIFPGFSGKIVVLLALSMEQQTSTFLKVNVADYLSFIKTSVRQVQAYTLTHLEAPVKINQNENPFDLPEPIKTAANQFMAERAWSRYPPFVPTTLTSKLAEFTGWKADGILVGNGSNELIQSVLMVVVEPGKSVVIPQPTFALYKLMTIVLGGTCDEVFLTSTFEFDVPRLLESVRKADLTIICSPNNPTGGLLPPRDLKELLKAARGLVLVDEAYHEFSRQSVVPLLSDFENLIVLRTYSKAMAMAGLRVGYLLGQPALVKEISKAKLPYNLNVFSMATAEAAIGHFHLLKPQVELLIEERERVYAELGRIPGVRALSSQANFIAFETPLEPQIVFDRLYAQGILVRDISRYPMLERFLRVSIGSPRENDQFLSALKGALG
jgi:histidinol-phosphate aminotransferase